MIFLCTFCQKKGMTADSLGTIGSFTISENQLASYNEMRRFYPEPLQGVFPGNRSGITGLIETQILFNQAVAKKVDEKIKKSADWKWKSFYFSSQFYLSGFFQKNVGFTDAEILAYYTANKDSFKVTLKADSTRAKDSVFFRPLAEVQRNVTSAMIQKKFPPTPAFVKSFAKDTSATPAAIKARWTAQIERDLPGFFSKVFYKELYKKEFPDSAKDWYGTGKFILPTDVDVVLKWLPERERGRFLTDRGKQEIAEYLLKWKIFTEKAQKDGSINSDKVKNGVEWALKTDIVMFYVDSVLTPAMLSSVTIDTAFFQYGVMDKRNTPFAAQVGGSMIFAKDFDEFKKGEVVVSIDSLIYALRLKAPVKIRLGENKDTKMENPALLLKEADSATASGNTSVAEEKYTKLVSEFGFSIEGKKALPELAKLQVEKGMYQQAVENYRKYTYSTKDAKELCKTFFMIGFIYDEHINNAMLAETNYKWILKNTPDCELADDAEFMVLHLNESLSNVEDLQSESKRQGRKASAEGDVK